MQIVQTVDGGARVLALSGRLDSVTCGTLQQSLFAAIDAGAGVVVIDFADLAYVGSAGLRVLLMAAKRLRASQGKLALCGLNSNIREVFAMSGFDKILTIAPDRADALTAVS